ncbi:uncharacterized [Tachysurus ichikawai]
MNEGGLSKEKHKASVSATCINSSEMHKMGNNPEVLPPRWPLTHKIMLNLEVTATCADRFPNFEGCQVVVAVEHEAPAKVQRSPSSPYHQLPLLKEIWRLTLKFQTIKDVTN